MADVVQAKCPHCKATLRVPVDWLGKSLRCKHCKQVFQAKSQAPIVPPATPLPEAKPALPEAKPVAWLSPKAPVAPASPLPAAGPSADPFAFDDGTAPVRPVTGKPQPREKGWWKGAAIGGLAIVIAGGLLLFFRDDIALLFNPEAKPEPIALAGEQDKDLSGAHIVVEPKPKRTETPVPKKETPPPPIQKEKKSGPPPVKDKAPEIVNKPATEPVAVELPDGAGAKFANRAIVQGILDEMNLIPPAKPSQRQTGRLVIDKLPPFAVADLEPYKPDYKGLKDLQAMVKAKPEQYALRGAILNAATALEQSFRFSLKEHLTGAPGATGVSDALKKQILAEQKAPAKVVFQLEMALAELMAAGEKRSDETSKRWQAHYDFCLARLMSRIVFISEHNYMLALVRGDSLPPLEKGHTGWRLSARAKVQVGETKYKDMVKQAGKTWQKIATEHPGTPWALIARREEMNALGLEWVPSKD